MSRFEGELKPGDVVLTRTKHFVALLIRLGAAFTDRPNLVNHCVIVHHRDDAGVLWGIEGRGGGVGWVDMAKYENSKYVNANTQQPKTEDQRKIICSYAKSLLGTPYDWSAIVEDAMRAFNMDRLWNAKEYGEKEVPGHVVCSSFADWCYEQAHLASPGKNVGTRFTTPADWDDFIMEKEWLNDPGP